MDELLMGEAAAQHAGLSRQRLYQLAANGDIGRKVSGHWVFTRAELDAYKAREKSKGGRPKSATTMASPAFVV
jgi:hypothetical protein